MATDFVLPVDDVRLLVKIVGVFVKEDTLWADEHERDRAGSILNELEIALLDDPANVPS